MSDIADIMGLKRPQKDDIILQSPVARSEKKRPQSKEKKKPEDITLFKKKRIVGTRGAHWNWKSFQNPGRNDKLTLLHWQKQDDYDEYFFHRFDKKVEIFDYTPEIYQEHLLSNEWSKEETDELWDLLKLYDIRFIVVADRISKPRTIEEIKDRYYTISKTLLQLNSQNTEDISSHPLIAFPYNRESEEKRKQENEILYNRTKEQVEEENYLRGELKRIEAAMKKQQILKKKKVLKKREELNNSETILSLPTSSKKELKVERKGTTLRSLSMVNPLCTSNKIQKKVEEVLLNEDLAHMPMATLEISHAFQKLQQDILISLDLEKHIQQQQCLLQQVEGKEKVKRINSNDPNKAKKKKKKKE